MRVYNVLNMESGEPTISLPENCLEVIMQEIKNAEIGDEIRIKVAEMTEEEFDNLPEY
jgi:hypothetical protein